MNHRNYFDKVWASQASQFGKTGELNICNQLITCYMKAIEDWQGLSYKKVIELGCGEGLLTRELLRNFPGIHLTVVDFAQELLNKTRESCAPYMKNVAMICSDIGEFVPEVNCYDAVISSFTLHHIPMVEKMVIFQRLLNSLKPQGIFMNGDIYLPESSAEASFFYYMRDRILAQKLTREELECRKEHRKWESLVKLSSEIKALSKLQCDKISVLYKEFNMAIVFLMKDFKEGI